MKPIGILFDSYEHFEKWEDEQGNIHAINISTHEWVLNDSPQVYLAIIPDNSIIEEDSFDRWNRYQGIEFKDILSPDYKPLDYIPSWLKYRIR